MTAVLFIALALIAIASIHSENRPPILQEGQKYIVVYSDDCPSCDQVKPLIKDLVEHPKVLVVNLSEHDESSNPLNLSNTHYPDTLPSVYESPNGWITGPEAVQSVHNSIKNGNLGDSKQIVKKTVPITNLKGPVLAVASVLGIIFLGLNLPRSSVGNSVLGLVIAFAFLIYKTSGACIECSSTGWLDRTMIASGLALVILMALIVGLEKDVHIIFVYCTLVVLSIPFALQSGGVVPSCASCIGADLAMMFAVSHVSRNTNRLSKSINLARIKPEFAAIGGVLVVFAAIGVITSTKTGNPSRLIAEGTVLSELKEEFQLTRDLTWIYIGKEDCMPCIEPDRVATIVKQNGVQVIDAEQLSQEFLQLLNPNGIFPCSYIIDRDFRIVAALPGATMSGTNRLYEILTAPPDSHIYDFYWSMGYRNGGFGFLGSESSEALLPLSAVFAQSQEAGIPIGLILRESAGTSTVTWSDSANSGFYSRATSDEEFQVLHDIEGEIRSNEFLVTRTGYVFSVASAEEACRN